MDLSQLCWRLKLNIEPPSKILISGVGRGGKRISLFFRKLKGNKFGEGDNSVKGSQISFLSLFQNLPPSGR
jgi:hypothetical protein